MEPSTITVALLTASPAQRLASITAAWSKAAVRERQWTAQGRWLRFGHVIYSVGERVYPPWEMVERAQRTAATTADAVDILAFVYSKAWAVPRLAAVVNFRPAVGGLVLELPAGLIDHNETAEQAARRELREEVGLVGVAAPEPLPFVYDPGITNESGLMVRVRVDLDAEREPSSGSIHPGATPEDTELVAPLLLPLENLSEQLRDYHRTFGVALDSRLLAFAHGWDMGRAWMIAPSPSAVPSPSPSAPP